MRLALLSDIHGNFHALKAVVEDLGRRGVDAVVNLGDSLSGPLLPVETAAYLMAQPWTHLAGNHERQLLELSERSGASDRYAHAQLGKQVFDWIAGLKPALALSSEVFLCHGTPRSDAEGFLESVESGFMRAAFSAEVKERLGKIDAEMVACGHTHVPRVMRSPSGQLLVNPGSVGLQAYEAESRHYVVENGSPDARYAIVERRNGAWTAQLIAVPYDSAEMVRLAGLRRRPDWEAALASGYIRSFTGDTRS